MSAVDEYLGKVPAPQRGELERVRNIVKETVSEAEEVISYGMPGFKYQKKYLFGYAAFKDHMSIFPTAAPVEALQEKLSDFELSKGTVQFTLEHPVPEAIIKELVSVRVKAIIR
jgi:uncharacterized protein YdhG (YjbR/CyaY superfamily)